MGFLDQLKAVWPLVTQAPWGFAPVAFAVLASGWAVGRFMYGQRIALLKERIESYKEKLDGASPEEARLRIDRLEARIRQLEATAPRTLGPEQMEAIAEAGRRSPGRILITYDSAASDGGALQAQFLQAFRKAGWTASGNFMAGGEDDYLHEFVLNLPADATPASQAARTALQSAKISFASGQRSNNIVQI
ncbi:hypothetical protein D3227_02125 [Mesorhizobium waimense]|uniref:Uncharacterized protein n=1 Tax=Mesorhizobium waimense TaxID=1300307 RepID=A0A3A5L2W8_9HYPH|nr:hypothetical protein [Mesorhizobium waimense]RJT42671.1 hypothetical protein D3227_02125 [Mesorhizobium waimense]